VTNKSKLFNLSKTSQLETTQEFDKLTETPCRTHTWITL